MHPALLWALILTGAFVAIAATGWLSRLRSARIETERAREAEIIEQEIAEGLRLPSGKIACIVCREAEATAWLPVIGVSFIDRMNPLRDLYSTTPLYRRRDYIGEHRAVCATHRDLVASIIDEQLADIRRKTAGFTAEVERHVAALRTGEILQIAKSDHLRAVTRLARASQAGPLLLAKMVESEEETAVSGQNGKSTHIEAN